MIYPEKTLQHPTLFSTWGIARDQEEAIMAYIDFYLKDIESKIQNQNITAMEIALKNILTVVSSNPDIPEEIRKNIPKDPEVEFDRAVRINLGEKLLVRYYNPDIAGAEKPFFTDSSLNYDIRAKSLAGSSKPDFHYLRKQVLLLKEKKQDRWYARKIDLVLDKDQIKLDLEKISETADLVMPFFLRNNEDPRYSILDPMEDMKRFVSELKQTKQDIDGYIKALDLFEELIALSDPDANILERYVEKFYYRLQPGDHNREGPIKDLEETKKIFRDIFSDDKISVIERDPLAYASRVFTEMLRAHEFFNCNHRMASFVCNFILVKNGYPYFSIKPSNLEQYYRRSRPHSIGVVSGAKDIEDFFRKELNPEIQELNRSGISSDKGIKKDSVPWYNRFVDVRFPPKKTRERLVSAVKRSDEIAENFGVNLMKKTPKTGNKELDEAVLDILKTTFKRGIESFDIEKYCRAAGVLSEMLADKDMTSDKMEAYIERFQKMSMGDSNYGYMEGNSSVRKEFREILSELFSDIGAEEIKEDIFFYASVVFVEIVRLQPFKNGNHRAADLVLNFILMKNGYPSFNLNEENISKYYELFNTFVLEEWDFNMYEIAEFFRTEVNKNRDPEYMPGAWHEITPDNIKKSLVNEIAGRINDTLNELPLLYVKNLSLTRHIDAKIIEIFFRVLEDKNLNFKKLARYILEFYSVLYPDQFLRYKEYYELPGGVKKAYQDSLQGKILERAFDEEDRAFIVRDPLGFAVKLFQGIITSDFFIVGKHENALFVMNLILARNGLPYFILNSTNVEKYYDMFNYASVDKGEYSLLQMRDFFREEIDKAYTRQKKAGSLYFAEALFADPKKGEVRQLKGTPFNPDEISEKELLNRVIRKLLLNGKLNLLKKNDPMVIFFRDMDNYDSSKVSIRVFKEEDLKRELGRSGYIADGLITHVGRYEGGEYDIYVPYRIYEQIVNLAGYEPASGDVAHILSSWWVQQHERSEGTPEESVAKSAGYESGLQLWLYSRAKRLVLSAINDKDPKIKVKKLRAAGVLIKASLDLSKDYFFLYELEGDIFYELARITNHEKHYSRSLSSYTIALSDLSLQQSKILEEHDLVFKILELIEVWAGKKYDGTMTKKAKTRLNYVIKNTMNPQTTIQLDPASIKKYNDIVDEYSGPGSSEDDPFFPKFSMIPVIIQYLKKYQKNLPETAIIKNLLFAVKKDLPEEDGDERKKTWDDLRAKVYHYCGVSFMDKGNFNSWIDASKCFKKELECENPDAEAYYLLINSGLRVDRSGEALKNARKVILEGYEEYGPMELWKRAELYIDGIEHENKAIFAKIKESFDRGEYSASISEMKSVYKRFGQVKFDVAIDELIDTAKFLKTEKKKALSPGLENKPEQTAAILMNILELNPSDIEALEALDRVQSEIEEKKQEENKSRGNHRQNEAARPVNQRIKETEKYISEARNFVGKGRIERARQRYAKAGEALREARKLLDPIVFEDKDMQYFNGKIRAVKKQIKTGVEDIAGLPDKIAVKKNKHEPDAKKRQKKPPQQASEKDMDKTVKEETYAKVFVPRVFVTKKVLDFLEKSYDKDILSNNIISGFERLMENKFNKKKKWRMGKDDRKLSRLRLGRHYRIFYTTTEKGDIMALFVIRKGDTRYANPRIKDLFSAGFDPEQLKSSAIRLDKFKDAVRENGVDPGIHESGQLKAPFSLSQDEDAGFDPEHMNEVLSTAVKSADSDSILSAVSHINTFAPTLTGDRIDGMKIKLLIADVPGLGFPRNKGAREPSELIYAYGKKRADILEIYVTRGFYEIHLRDNLLATAELIDHEYTERILGYSHRVASSRARLFVPEKEILSPFHLFYIKLIAKNPDPSIERKLLNVRHQTKTVRDAYSDNYGALKAIREYEAKIYRFYSVCRNFYADARKSPVLTVTGEQYAGKAEKTHVIDSVTGRPFPVYIAKAGSDDIQSISELNGTGKMTFDNGKKILKLYTKETESEEKVRGGVFLKKEEKDKYGFPFYSVTNIIVEKESRTGQEDRQLKYLGWKLLEFAVKESLTDKDTAGATVVYTNKELSFLSGSLTRLGFRDIGNGVFLLEREDARSFLLKIDNLFKGASWFIRMQFLAKTGKQLLIDPDGKAEDMKELASAFDAMAGLSSGIKKKGKKTPIYPDLQKDLTVELVKARTALALKAAEKLKELSEEVNIGTFNSVIAPLSSVNTMDYYRENLFQKYRSRLLAETSHSLSEKEVKEILDHAVFQSLSVTHSLVTFLLVEYLIFQFPDIRRFMDPSVLTVLSYISTLENEDRLFDSCADILENSMYFLNSITEHIYDKKDIRSEAGPGIPWETGAIIDNVEKVIPRLIQSMIKLSGTIASEEEKRKVIMLIDSDISGSSGIKIKDGLSAMIETLALKKDNSKALGLFLKNIEIRKGRARELLAKTGNVPGRDIVIITNSDNYSIFDKMKENGSLVTVFEKKDGSEEFPKDAYLPLIEVIFLTVIKYMHINTDEDLRDLIASVYNGIPNVRTLEELNKEEYTDILGKNTNRMIIRLIPNAKKFESKDFTDPMERVREFLVKA